MIGCTFSLCAHNAQREKYCFIIKNWNLPYQTNYNAVVGADAHIGPIGAFFIRADVGIGPYG